MLRFVLCLVLPLAAAAQPYDLLLRGGRVLDPGSGVDLTADVAVTGSKISRIAPGIPPGQARRVVDASGLYVVPGLVDLHAHVFGYDGSLKADDAMLPYGTTTVCDAGGAGWRTFDEFQRTVIAPSKTRILAFLNIVGKGMVGEEAENDETDMDPERTAALVKRHAGLIVGIKTAHYSKPGWTALRRAVEAGRLSNTPVMVDNNILSYTGRDTRTKVLEILRPGDIHTHMYNDRHLELIDRFSAKVTPALLEARKRGVLFDLGHGSGSFLWPVATRAAAQGFWPDTISTDLHQSSILTQEASMPNCMSKMLALGMPLAEAVRRSTETPARAIGRYPELGVLREGAIADIAVLELRQGAFAFKDAWNKKLIGTARLENVATVRNGELVYERAPRRGPATSGPVYDLLLKNGRVVDPENRRDGRIDIAIAGGRIVAVAPDLETRRARRVIDASAYSVKPGAADPAFGPEVNARFRALSSGATGSTPGSLAVGSPANVALFTEGPDTRCVLTVREGKVVWDSEGLAATDWTEAGPYSNYR